MNPFLTLFTYPDVCTMQTESVLTNEDKQLQAVAAGTVYNYAELRTALESQGHTFATADNAEVIVHLYEEYGVDCLQHLRGPIAFALYDKQQNQLLVARDRMGEKTLYYAHTSKGLVFSPSLKDILQGYIPEPQINMHALAEAIRYNFPINLQQTFIEQIKRVRAGEYVLINTNGLTTHTYWKHTHNMTFSGTKEDAKQQTLQLMRESVDLCFRSKEPIAVMLSGGIDSSAIAALAKEAGHEVHAISAGYKGQFACDERDVARRFAKERGFHFHEIELDVNDFKHYFDEYMAYIDEPCSDVSAMSQYAVYKKAAEMGFKVVMSGLGGDEVFYGYPYCNKLAQQINLRREHQQLFPWKGIDKKKKFIKFCLKNWRYILFAGYPTKLDDAIPIAWTFEDYNKFASSAVCILRDESFYFLEEDVHLSFPNDADVDVLYDFMFSRFMNTLCLYLGERLGSAAGVEVRSPLIDFKLVDFVSSIPLSMKYNAANPKAFLKETLSGIVPDYILYAQKRGFTPPFDYIYEMNINYKYKVLKSEHVFYNSMLADTLLNNLKLL